MSMEAFIKFMTAFASSVWNWLFIIAFIGAGLYFYRQFMARIAGKINQLEQSKAILEKYNAENIHFNYEPFKAEVKKDELLASPWAKYEKTLLIDVHQNPAMVYSTVDAEEYFNAANLSGGMNVGYLSGFAGVFTGIGILGTFLGLTVGLAGIDTTSTNTLSSSISSLLSGMSTAFVTSLLGIVFAIPCGYFYSKRMETFKIEVAQVAEMVDAIFVRKNLEAIMMDQVAESQAQRVALESLSTDMANAICGQLPDILGQIADRIDSSLQGNLENMLTGLSEKLDQQAEELKKQTLTLEKVVANTDSLSTGILGKFGDAINEGAGKEAKALGNSLQKLSDEISGLSAKLTTMIDDSRNTSAKVNEEMLAAVKKAIDNLDQTMETIMRKQTQKTDENVQKMTDLMEEMKQTMKDIFEKMSDAAEDQADKNKKAGADIRGAIEAAGKATTANINQINGTVKSLMEEIAKQMKSMQNMMDDHERNMAKTLSDMKDAVASSGMVVEKAGSTVKEFNRTIDHTAECLETAANSAAGVIADSAKPLKQAVEPLQNVAITMDTNLKVLDRAMKESNQVTTTAMNQMKSMVEQNQLATMEIQDAVKSTEASWKAYETQFNGVNKEMKDIFEQLETGLQNYNRTTNEGLTEKLKAFDKSVAEVVDRLASLNEETNDLVDDLNKNLTRMRR